jgi:dihydroorotase
VGTLAKLTSEPAKLLRFQDGRGEIRVGGVGDLTLFDLDEAWTSSRDDTASKSSNNPFHGWRLRGRVRHTIVGGRRVWSLQPVG